jgi:hypothetical protein
MTNNERRKERRNNNNLILSHLPALRSAARFWLAANSGLHASQVEGRQTEQCPVMTKP